MKKFFITLSIVLLLISMILVTASSAAYSLNDYSQFESTEYNDENEAYLVSNWLEVSLAIIEIAGIIIALLIGIISIIRFIKNKDKKIRKKCIKTFIFSIILGILVLIVHIIILFASSGFC